MCDGEEVTQIFSSKMFPRNQLEKKNVNYCGELQKISNLDTFIESVTQTHKPLIWIIYL